MGVRDQKGNNSDGLWTTRVMPQRDVRYTLANELLLSAITSRFVTRIALKVLVWMSLIHIHGYTGTNFCWLAQWLQEKRTLVSPVLQDFSGTS